jgi:acetoacetyl-CoA synthetase
VEPEPVAIASPTQLSAFVSFCEERAGRRFEGPRDFERFSFEAYRDFWALFLEWADLAWEGEADPVCTSESCESADFFPGLRLSYAENLLRSRSPQDDSRVAVIARHADGCAERIRRAELRERVRRLAGHLQSLGVEPGDRLVAIAANNAEAMVGALAASAIGATFSSAALDMGAPAIVSRFEQLSPKLMLANLGESGPGGSGLGERVASVAAALPSLSAVIALDGGAAPAGIGPPVLRIEELLSSEPDRPLGDGWPRFPFNHPLFILFTSGTTGPPKCVVHGAGGTLLEHLKEHRLHTDLGDADTLFFHTSAAWMMWNWQLSALACESAIVAFDGPVSGPATLWEVVAGEAVTVFGTSPPYLQLCEDSGYSPRREAAPGHLRSVLSTGSVLRDWQFDWVAEEVGPVKLQSISGGTDIIGCFVLGHPELPISRGAIQCRSLGLDVQALPTEETPTDSPVGELICRNPFPSRPLGFVGDDGSRFHEAYFSQSEGVWTHGDLIEFDEDGFARIHGRSDGVLNIQGVRIGPAEIYQALHAVPEVVEAMAVEQRNGNSSRLVLLVVLRDGVSLDGPLTLRIRRAITAHATPLHVPRLIAAVPELPVTHSGKRSERAGRDAVEGRSAANRRALANPESLEAIAGAVAEAERAAAGRSAAAARPGAPTAERVRAIWEEVLGVEALAPDEDFFAIGGTSLMAVELFAKIRDRLGAELPPSTLLEAPTISSLAAFVDDPTKVDPLVQMRRGSDGPPLFIIHSIWGDVLGMRQIAIAMREDIPVYGLRARGIFRGDQPDFTVEGLASAYVDIIREVDPHGPYRLAGHSFGALIAFEMARQLTEAGSEVGWLGVIDGELSTGCHSPLRRGGHRLALPFHYLRAALRRPRETITTGIREKIPNLARRAVLRLFPGAPIAGPRVEWMEGASEADQRFASRSIRAADAYRPKPYLGPMTYFLPTVRRFHLYADPMPVWRRVAKRGLQLERVPGPHVGMVSGPGATLIAAAIDRDLAAGGAKLPQASSEE